MLAHNATVGSTIFDPVSFISPGANALQDSAPIPTDSFLPQHRAFLLLVEHWWALSPCRVEG